MRFQLLADAVRDDFPPVDFGAGDGQLSAEGLERGLRHGLIVLRYCHLVILLAIFDHLDDLLRCLNLIRYDQRLAAFL